MQLVYSITQFCWARKQNPHLSFRMSFLKGKHKESNTGNENMFERDCKLALGKEGVVFQPRDKKQLTFLVIFVYIGGQSFYEVAFFEICTYIFSRLTVLIGFKDTLHQMQNGDPTVVTISSKQNTCWLGRKNLLIYCRLATSMNSRQTVFSPKSQLMVQFL